MAQTVEFRVYGRPAPQGSKAYKGNQRFVEASKYLPAWRKAVKNAAAVAQGGAPLFEAPVRVEVRFWLERPKKPKFDRPGTPPDLDKLCRAVFDALSGTVWLDDALVVDLNARAFWTTDTEAQGCHITVFEAL